MRLDYIIYDYGIFLKKDFQLLNLVAGNVIIFGLIDNITHALHYIVHLTNVGWHPASVCLKGLSFFISFLPRLLSRCNLIMSWKGRKTLFCDSFNVNNFNLNTSISVFVSIASQNCHISQVTYRYQALPEHIVSYNLTVSCHIANDLTIVFWIIFINDLNNNKKHDVIYLISMKLTVLEFYNSLYIYLGNLPLISQ